MSRKSTTAHPLFHRLFQANMVSSLRYTNPETFCFLYFPERPGFQDVITSYSIHYTKLYETTPDVPFDFLGDRVNEPGQGRRIERRRIGLQAVERRVGNLRRDDQSVR